MQPARGQAGWSQSVGSQPSCPIALGGPQVTGGVPVVRKHEGWAPHSSFMPTQVVWLPGCTLRRYLLLRTPNRLTEFKCHLLQEASDPPPQGHKETNCSRDLSCSRFHAALHYDPCPTSRGPSGVGQGGALFTGIPSTQPVPGKAGALPE